MSKFTDFFKFSIKDVQEIEPGFYTSHDLMHGAIPYRLHLRVEPDHQGLLTLNASTVLHLNKTAMEMAYFLIKGQNPSEIAKSISQRYKAPKDEIKRDVDNFYETLTGFIFHEDLPPTTILGQIENPEQSDIVAPYRLDCYFSPTTERSILNTAEWKIVFEKAFNAGIPHVMLVDVHDAFVDELPDLLRHIEELGLVSGLVTDLSELKNDAFIDEILACGLDHLLIDADPRDQENLAQILHILSKDIFTCLRMPFDADFDYSKIMQELFAQGINAFAFSNLQDELDINFLELQALISEHGISIVDDMPQPRLADELKIPFPTNNKINLKYLALLPNGDLLIPSDKPITIGNLLQEGWNILWAKCQDYSHG